MVKRFVLILVIFWGFAAGAQVGIATVTPDPSSILDITAADKGLLVPRVALNSVNNAMINGTDTNAEGLLIYNTNASVTGGSGSGFYYWDGSSTWIKLTTGSGGAGGSGWLLTGNTANSADFLGTLNNQPLTIRVNNQPKTRITSRGQIETLNTNNSVYLGEGAGAFSYSAGSQNNIFIGYQADYDSGGASNSIILGHNSRVSSNNSIVIGAQADADASNSIAIGRGTQSQGTYGIVIGDASYSRATNTVALGREINIQGNNSSGIGSNIFMSHSNSIVLGNKVNSTKNNQLRLGNISEVDLNGATIVNISDGRFKYDVQENVKGLDFIKALRPVTYKLDVEKYNAFHNNETSITNTQKVETGFIAQEVEQAMNKTNFNFNGVVIPEDATIDNYKLSYDKFVVPLVQALQEQQQQIELLQQQVYDLKNLEREVSQLKALLVSDKLKTNDSLFEPEISISNN